MKYTRAQKGGTWALLFWHVLSNNDDEVLFNRDTTNK